MAAFTASELVLLRGRWLVCAADPLFTAPPRDVPSVGLDTPAAWQDGGVSRARPLHALSVTAQGSAALPRENFLVPIGLEDDG